MTNKKNTKNIDYISRSRSRLEKSISDCSTDSLPQSIEMAIHIERAFYEKEISDSQRAIFHKTLDEFVKDFFVRCKCEKEIPMSFD